MVPRNRELTVRALARVEGEGRVDVTVHDGRAERVELSIYEPPRFFESFLRGRHFLEPPDITSRICGICPVAYQVSACNAVEQACELVLDRSVLDLRRLLYCGEWIASHVLHIYFLHAPDFFGVPDSIALARHDREAVERGLALKKAGNAILELIGGRPIHPVNVRIGGFHRTPTRAELGPLADQLRTALDHAVATVEWVSAFEFPDIELDHDLVALHDDSRYAIEDGEIWSSSGLRCTADEFPHHVTEHQVPHSTALHAELDGRRYLAGPLARYSINSAQLTDMAARTATAAGLQGSCRNPYRSIIIRAVEVVYAVEEALRIIERYDRPMQPFIAGPPVRSVGHGVSEAPRGLLYHRYELDPTGLISAASIIPPTSQNQAAIEYDLRRTVDENLTLTDDELTALCERTIRNYDPCISCATHFLTLKIHRR
ncbi:dehydrogenase [Rhodococcus sp. WMMA185]|uniref:Ni/Fe hydrogenase subunit alpha n=1 Tax=Rhodococcus sp. WMMA185 TaxID=679318 RepID=UPI00087817D2|nr:nickel-dependent hydrogenase large subunit [Rhodococcus sp. WMMA185]AOW92644.1 dehydrogenase [Rhodococcus sp. WMMA185]